MSSIDHLLQLIKKSVNGTDPDASVILYGSYARKDNRADSDLDILVLISKDKVTIEDEKRIGNPIYHLELESGIIINPMIFAKKTWETKYKINPFYKNVTREGILL